jgi:hypothetical protein
MGGSTPLTPLYAFMTWTAEKITSLAFKFQTRLSLNTRMKVSVYLNLVIYVILFSIARLSLNSVQLPLMN